MPSVLSGLSVVTPAAWWALSVLLIPVLIHLFNRSRGRLVRIGHIDLVRKARTTRVSEIRLAQWLLLLLRLGIFTLATLILAGLARPGLESRTEDTIYVAPAWLMTAEKDAIDALLALVENEPGAKVLPGVLPRVFLLETDFPPLDRQMIENRRNADSEGSDSPASIWPLLTERLSREHHGGAVTVYVTDYMLQFGALWPDLPRQVKWSVSRPQKPLHLSTAPIHAVIAYAPDRSADAALFGMALAALQQHRLPGLSWESIGPAPTDLSQLQADWLILLSDSSPGTGQLAQLNASTVILTDASGSEFKSTRQRVDLPIYPFSTFSLSRYLPAVTDSSAFLQLENRQVLLASSDGSPLLQVSQNGSLRWLHFSSRFSPDWSSIMQQLEFPELLLQWMTGGDFRPARYADARIHPARLVPAPANSDPETPLPRRSLHSLLALILALLWMTERWLSARRPRETR